MKNQAENSTKESLRIEKLKAEEAKLLSKEQEKTQAYLVREQEIEKGQKIKENQQAEDRLSEETRELVKEKARKEAYLAREKMIAQEQETRKLKSKHIV